MSAHCQHPGRRYRVRRAAAAVLPPLAERDRPGDLVAFCATAVFVGAVTGLVARAFWLCLEAAVGLRERLQGWATSWWGQGVVVLVCGGAVALAAALVHRIEPHAEGSGIPRVEGIVEGRIDPGSPKILPVKFVGGVLAIGAGLALGREGPSVQMGASVATIVGRALRRNRYDVRLLVAAGAAAGLATAFNAPIAGGVFVLEELLRRFDPRTSVATLLASGAGFASAQLFIGRPSHIFTMEAVGAPRLKHMPVVLLIGVACGVLGVLYNVLVVRSLRWADRNRLPRELRAGLVGAATGVMALTAVDLVGGGDGLTQRALLGQGTLLSVAGILALRLVFSVVSYAAATPGGIFAPMLVLGTHTGLLVGLTVSLIAPGFVPPLGVVAFIGLAAFFTASVQAPITGLVLAIELTGVTNQLPPMMGGCAVAMLVAMGLRARPVYEALTTRSVRAARQNSRQTGWRD